MEDTGSLIFYIILALIVLVGSLQGRKKKAPAGKPKPSGMTVTDKREQTTATSARTAKQVQVPQYKTPEPYEEGSYKSPLAGEFASEGSFSKTMADGFAGEGSIYDTMAAAFVSEGISSLSGAQIKSTAYNAITESEIHDMPEYAYGESVADDLLSEGFDLRKAVIYSAILENKWHLF
jgi:hypothetical protein